MRQTRRLQPQRGRGTSDLVDTSEEQKAQVAWLRKPGRAKSPTVQVVAHTSKTQVQPYWTTKLRFGDSGGKPVLRALHVAASGSVCSTLAGRRLASVVGRARRLVRSRAVGKAVPHCSPGALGSFGHIKSRVCDIRLADNLELIRAVLGCLRNSRAVGKAVPATPVMSAAHCAFAPAQSKAAAVAAADEFVRKDAARLRSDAQACGRSVKQRVDG